MGYLFYVVQNNVDRIKTLSKCLFGFEKKNTAGETLAVCSEVFLLKMMFWLVRPNRYLNSPQDSSYLRKYVILKSKSRMPRHCLPTMALHCIASKQTNKHFAIFNSTQLHLISWDASSKKCARDIFLFQVQTHTHFQNVTLYLAQNQHLKNRFCLNGNQWYGTGCRWPSSLSVLYMRVNHETMNVKTISVFAVTKSIDFTQGCC